MQRINITEIDREQVDSRIQENEQAMQDKSYIDSRTRKATGWNQLIKIWYLKVHLQATLHNLFVHHMVKTQDGMPDLFAQHEQFDPKPCNASFDFWQSLEL